MDFLRIFLLAMGVVVYLCGLFPTIREMFLNDHRALGITCMVILCFPGVFGISTGKNAALPFGVIACALLSGMYALLHLDDLKQAFSFQVAGMTLFLAGCVLSLL